MYAFTSERFKPDTYPKSDNDVSNLCYRKVNLCPSLSNRYVKPGHLGFLLSNVCNLW